MMMFAGVEMTFICTSKSGAYVCDSVRSAIDPKKGNDDDTMFIAFNTIIRGIMIHQDKWIQIQSQDKTNGKFVQMIDKEVPVFQIYSMDKDETPQQRSDRIATIVEAECRKRLEEISSSKNAEEKTPPLPKFPNLGVCFEVIHELLGNDTVGGLTRNQLAHYKHFGHPEMNFEPIVPRIRTLVEDLENFGSWPPTNRQDKNVAISRVTAGTPWAPEDPAVGSRVQVQSVNDPSGRPLIYPAKILQLNCNQQGDVISCDVEYVELTTDEFKWGVVVPLTKNAGCCFAELLQERVKQIKIHSPTTKIPENLGRKKLVSEATHFVSHAWKYKFADVVSALTSYHLGLSPSEQRNAYYWFDVLTVDQNMQNNPPSEWWSSVFRDAIAKFGQVLLVLSPAKNPIPFTRSWCLWELWSTIEQNVNLQMLLTGDARREMMQLSDDRVASKDPKTETLFNEFVDAYSNVNIENAEAFNKTDQESILQAVKDSIGVQQLNDTTRAYCLGQLLPYVAAAGNVEKVNLLLEKGANMNVVKNIPPQYTTTAVGFACAHGHFAVAWLLLKAGADPSVTDQYGTTLLHFAAKYGNVQMCIDLLTKYKLNPNPQPTTDLNNTPLCIAVSHSNYILATTLIRLGACTDFVNTNDNSKHRIRGMMPLHKACRKSDPGMVDLLLKAGADVNATWMPAFKVGGPGNISALMMVVQDRMCEDHVKDALVTTLLAGGADVNIENEAGETAYDMAKKMKNQSWLPSVLVKAGGKEGSGVERGEYLQGRIEKRNERLHRGVSPSLGFGGL
jgi:ankyrin repeat protein